MNRKLIVAVLACALVSACGGTKSGKELFTINGKTFTEGYLDFLGTINPRIKAQLGNPMGRKQIVDNIIEQELFYQAAVKKGLDHDPQVKEKADLYRRVIIAQSYVEKQLESEAQKYYDDHKSDFEKLRMSHILIRTKAAPPPQTANLPKGAKPPVVEGGHTDAEALELATKIKERLDKKEDFATVAKEVSEDTVTKPNGGDLGDVSKTEQRLVRRGYEPLIEKAFSMKVGEVSAPIKTQDGYNIIVVTRGVEVEPFDAAKQGLMFKQQGELRNTLLTELKKQAKISYADASLKPQEMPTAVPNAPSAPHPAVNSAVPVAPDAHAAPAAKVPPAAPAPHAPATKGGK